ncbi:sensor protein ZraS [mine drainage metagenome]|uniref:Sensor protein ZraS n=1 Tax=mine drainage metagenome TaxID=410659 RepID=A0A1J5RP68_9ZZZZ
MQPFDVLVLHLLASGFTAFVFALVWYVNRRNDVVRAWATSQFATTASIAFGVAYARAPRLWIGLAAVLCISVATTRLTAGVWLYRRHKLRRWVEPWAAALLFASIAAGWALVSERAASALASAGLALACLWAGGFLWRRRPSFIDGILGALFVVRGVILLGRVYAGPAGWVIAFDSLSSLVLSLFLLVAIVLDVGDRERDRYRRLYQSMLDGYFISDRQRRFVDFNESFCRMLGYRAEELLDLSTLDITPSRWADTDHEIYLQLNSRGYSEIFEKEYLRRDGECLPVEIRAYAERDERGELVGYWAVVRDISARKQSERRKAAELREQRLQAVLEATGEGVWDWNVRAGTVYLSERWYQIFGLDAASTIRSLSDERYQSLLHPDDRDAVLARVQSCLDGGGRYVSQHRALRRDGEVIWLQSHGDVIERAADGAALRMVGSVIDITAQKRAEFALREAKTDAERANAELAETLRRLSQTQDELLRAEKHAALGALVAGVAHELNTPIGNAVTVSSTMDDAQRELRRCTESGLTKAALKGFLDTFAESSSILQRNLVRAADLVHNFKQLAVDQSSYSRRTFDLREVVAEVLIVMAPALRKARVELRCEIARGIAMDSYPGPLTQALMALIDNALVHAFVDGGGHLVLHAEPDGDGEVCIELSDDGVGIAPEVLRRIFDPFFTTRLGRGGSGLGLHLVYNIATVVMAGHIDVRSAPGQGSTFTLRLPRVAADADGDVLSSFRAASTPSELSHVAAAD